MLAIRAVLLRPGEETLTPKTEGSQGNSVTQTAGRDNMHFWLEDDIQRVLRSVSVARSPLTTDDLLILRAIAEAFGVLADFERWLKDQVGDSGIIAARG